MRKNMFVLIPLLRKETPLISITLGILELLSSDYSLFYFTKIQNLKLIISNDYT